MFGKLESDFQTDFEAMTNALYQTGREESETKTAARKGAADLKAFLPTNAEERSVPGAARTVASECEWGVYGRALRDDHGTNVLWLRLQDIWGRRFSYVFQPDFQ